MFSSKILLLKKYNQDYNELLKYKWLWYTGKLDDDLKYKSLVGRRTLHSMV